MSAPLKLTSDSLLRLSKALDDLSKVTRHHGVRLTAYGNVDVAIDGYTISVAWDADAEQYVIDDRIGG